MRVMFTSIAGAGHVHPMVPLGQAFLERGDELLWTTSADLGAVLQAEGFRTAVAGLPIPAARAQVAAQFPDILRLPPAELPDAYFPKLFGAVLAPASIPDLLPIAQDFRPNLIVADTADFAAPLVAALLGVPSVSHSFGSLIPRARMEDGAAECAYLWTAHGLEARTLGG